MKTKLPWILAILLAITLVVVLVARPNAKTSATNAGSGGEKKVLYWVDSMNPVTSPISRGRRPTGWISSRCKRKKRKRKGYRRQKKSFSITETDKPHARRA